VGELDGLGSLAAVSEIVPGEGEGQGHHGAGEQETDAHYQLPGAACAEHAIDGACETGNGD
jgi:hypothetical protein